MPSPEKQAAMEAFVVALAEAESREYVKPLARALLAIIEREKQPEPVCAGTNVSAFDCPVHDPRKRKTAEAVLMEAIEYMLRHESYGRADSPAILRARDALALIRKAEERWELTMKNKQLYQDELIATSQRVERAITVLRDGGDVLYRLYSALAILEGRE